METLKSLSVYTKAIVEKLFAIKGFTPEETALYYYWPTIVGDEYKDLFSIEKIENLGTTFNHDIKRLHLKTKRKINPIEASYCVNEIKERIFRYYGYEFIQEIRVRKGK